MPKEDPEITLRLLNEIERNGDASQRHLSMRLGIAVGLTNAYIRRCVRKGLVKVSEVPARRYLYYLTPKGFSEKSRLTARYLESSFNLFRQARRQCLGLYRQCTTYGWQRIALYGDGDLAEIAALAAKEHGTALLGVVDGSSQRRQVAGVPVLAALPSAADIDAVLLTDIRNPQAAYKALRPHIADERILAPPLLMLSRDSTARAAHGTAARSPSVPQQ